MKYLLSWLKYYSTLVLSGFILSILVAFGFLTLGNQSYDSMVTLGKISGGLFFIASLLSLSLRIRLENPQVMLKLGVEKRVGIAFFYTALLFFLSTLISLLLSRVVSVVVAIYVSPVAFSILSLPLYWHFYKKFIDKKEGRDLPPMDL